MKNEYLMTSFKNRVCTYLLIGNATMMLIGLGGLETYILTNENLTSEQKGQAQVAFDFYCLGAGTVTTGVVASEFIKTKKKEKK
jgi:hypothetical protein